MMMHQPDCADPAGRRLFACNSAVNKDVKDKNRHRQSSLLTPMVTCVTPVAQHENMSSKERKLVDYIKMLEAKNDLLNKQLADLDCSRVQLALTLENLTLEMQQLKFEQSGEPVILGRGDDDDEKFRESSATRKRRVQQENYKLSHELAIMIQDFVTSSSLSDRRKFPTSRLAKIVIDSILSFE